MSMKLIWPENNRIFAKEWQGTAILKTTVKYQRKMLYLSIQVHLLGTCYICIIQSCKCNTFVEHHLVHVFICFGYMGTSLGIYHTYKLLHCIPYVMASYTCKSISSLFKKSQVGFLLNILKWRVVVFYILSSHVLPLLPWLWCLHFLDVFGFVHCGG